MEQLIAQRIPNLGNGHCLIVRIFLPAFVKESERKFEPILPRLDYFSHLFVVNLCWCLKRPKLKENEAGDGPFL